MLLAISRTGEGARDKTEHEADSLRAIRGYLTGKLSDGGERRAEGEVLSIWSFGITFISKSNNLENLNVLVIMRVFIINGLETHKKAERNEFGELPS